MEKEKNRIALSEILNEKGLQLLKEANKKIAQSPGPDAIPKKMAPAPATTPTGDTHTLAASVTIIDQ